MPTEPICTVAVAMAGVSLTLSLASLLGSRSTPAKPAKRPVASRPLAAKQVTLSERPSLKLTRDQLLEHARALGIGNARWRNSARKTELCQAIQAHNKARQVADG